MFIELIILSLEKTVVSLITNKVEDIPCKIIEKKKKINELKQYD